ncbi:MAG TPA: murein biosynthesis integral membrane protein MurJ, partial [Desulfuromonadales bacterium]|nr:murein biosynthesis integral membrane protein MurJ [Desulfuromonadales bacterium]
AGLGLWLMQVYSHVGLALALTFATVFNSAALLWALRRKIGSLGLSAVFGSVIRMIPPVIFMAAIVVFILRGGPWDNPDERLIQGGLLIAAVLAGVAAFSVGCLFFRVPEMKGFADIVRKRLGKGR